MDNEFAGSVSPEMTQVKAAAKAFFDSMELYMGAIQQLEDEMKRLQISEEVRYGKPLIQYDEAEEQILTVKDAREYIAAHGVRLLTEGLDKTGKRVRWSDSQIAVIYQSIYAQVQAIAGVQADLRGQGLTAEDIARAELTFSDFFPSVTIVLSSQVSSFAAKTEETQGGLKITIWNSGVYYWPSDTREAPVNVFSPELVTHEFGHALIYGWGEHNLQNLFEGSIEGNPSVITTQTGTEVAIWNPFEAGSPDTSRIRAYGRMYGGRGILDEAIKAILSAENPQMSQEQISELWISIQTQEPERALSYQSEALRAIVDERTAEAYAIWVYNNYNRIEGITSDSVNKQVAFWDAIFGNKR